MSSVHDFQGIIVFELSYIISLDKVSGRGKDTSFACFDFSTLYRKISNEKLLKILNEFIGFCFKGGDEELISVDDPSTRWGKKRRSGAAGVAVFTKSTLKRLKNIFYRIVTLSQEMDIQANYWNYKEFGPCTMFLLISCYTIMK